MSQDAIRFEALFSAPTQPESPAPADPGTPAPSASGHQDSYAELDRKYRHRTYQAQELMIEKLMRNRPFDEAAMRHRLMMMDLRILHPRFMVVLVRPEDRSESFLEYSESQPNGGQGGLIVSSIFSELLGEPFDCFPANLDNRYAFLLNFTSADDAAVSARVASICREGVRFIADNFSLSLLVCVSACCDGLSGVHDLFRETDMVLDDKNTAFSGGVCVRAESDAAPSGNILPHPSPSIEKQYLNALVTQDFDTALQVTMDRISAYSSTDPIDLDHVKMFLSMRLRTTSSVLGMPVSDSPTLGSFNFGEQCMQIDRCASLDEIKALLTDLFHQLDAHFNAFPSDYTGTTGKVIALIGKHYMEPDLSVEMICDSLGKSRSYLSRMFKENTGMNLLDYLHTTRLTEAKKLLNETDLGISEIAGQVGYYSGWTLARVFKRYEGITPTAYRKAFCSQSEV